MNIFILLLMGAFAFSKPGLEVHGHRGARGSISENTLPAFVFALESGVDVLELDLAVSADGVAVITHEPEITPERCLDPGGVKLKQSLLIHKLKYEEIKRYDCGSLPNERFPKQKQIPQTPMPRLEDLFALIQSSKLPLAKTVRFNIETKIYPAHPEASPPPYEFAALIIKTAKKFGMVKRVTIQSFDDRTLLAARKIEPTISTSLLTSDNHIDYVTVAQSAKVDFISPEHTWILPEDVKRLHRAGIKILPWTANESKDWDRLIKMGVDGIITDYPKELIEYLSKK